MLGDFLSIIFNMAPQSYIPPAANVLGTLGTVFWCIQLIPQIWQNWKHKKTEGLPAMMMLLWGICQSYRSPVDYLALTFSRCSPIRRLRSGSSTAFPRIGEKITEDLEFQYSHSNSTPDIRHTLPHHLGPDPHIYQVHLLQPLQVPL